MVYPLPAVLISVAAPHEEPNIFTVAWTGTVCTNPPMLYISVRPERYSYGIIKKTGEFTVNLTTASMAEATDFCGVKSGRDVNKWKETGLTPGDSLHLKYAPIVLESPVSIECKVNNIIELGSHHMFIADVLGIQVTENLIDKKGKFNLNRSGIMTYSHGSYHSIGKNIGHFGFSVKKLKSKNKFKKKNKK